jgi:hypothetical protein
MSKNLKTILAVLVTLMTLIGGIWAFGNTFATNSRVDKDLIEVAGAIQNQQIKSDYKFYQFMYDKLTQDMNEIKRQLRRTPDDQELRQDYQDIKEERNKIKEKMELMIKEIN